MSAQSAELRFRSITTIIKDLKTAGLWLEEEKRWDKAHPSPAYKKDTQMLDSLCNILVCSPGDVVAALMVIHQSGPQIVVAKSSPYVLATNPEESFQPPRVALKPPSDQEEMLTLVLEHVRKFKRGNEIISFKNHAHIITSLLQAIYEAQDKNQLVQIKEILSTYVLGMSLPKTIDRLYRKKGGLPQYVEIFKAPFRKELLGNMSAVFQVKDKHVICLLDWAECLLEVGSSTSCYKTALNQLKTINPSDMKFTEEIATVVHDIINLIIGFLSKSRIAELDRDLLEAVIQVQDCLSMLLSELKPFIKAYLRSIDTEKLNQLISEEDSSCAIIGDVEEEELSGSREDEEDNEIEVMKENFEPWSEICFYLLKRIALISSSLTQISSPSKAHPSLNRLLKSSSVTAIEPRNHDMKMEHWEDTVDYLLKDTHDVERKTLKNNLKRIVYRRTPLIFANAKKGDNIKLNSTNTLRFTGAYHCELALMALLLKANSDAQRPKDETSMMEPMFSQTVHSVKLGLSEPCCPICDFVIRRICTNESLSCVSYSGHHDHVYPCTLPADLPEAVLSESRLWAEALLRNQLTSTTFQDELNNYLKPLHLANDSTTSEETNALSISPEPEEDRLPLNFDRFHELCSHL